MAEGPYSRVYWQLMEEFPDVFDDDRALSAWIRLLITAEGMHPLPATLPRNVRKSALTKLVDAGLVQLLSGDRFRIRGLDAEREKRSSVGRLAATARWERNAPGVQPAMRTHSERNANALPTQSERSADGMLAEQSIDKQSKSRVTPAVDLGEQRAGSPTYANAVRAERWPSQPRLTKEQLESWATFTSGKWGPFREAWIGRGLHFAPYGSDTDEDTSQRGLLWQIADARPHDLARWVKEAPGKTPRDVLAYVITKWHSVRAEVLTDDEWEAAKQEDRASSKGAMQRLGDLIGDQP